MTFSDAYSLTWATFRVTFVTFDSVAERPDGSVMASLEQTA
ncbi:hypothetical protein RCH21_003424 [Arthrobacter sp. PL16]|nr:hypothetical protein [Arthrobacter sp. PL16]